MSTKTRLQKLESHNATVEDEPRYTPEQHTRSLASLWHVIAGAWAAGKPQGAEAEAAQHASGALDGLRATTTPQGDV
jgi:hypothetical protein